MASVVLEGISKHYGHVRAVDEVSLNIGDGQFLTLLGPSGCGKSTTLNLIAGLETPTAGKMWMDGKVVNDISPRDRNIALVFQSYALYPHMTIFENIAFPLKARRRMPDSELRERVKSVAHVLGIEELLSRYPKEISGGQRQRTALGRAMVRNPTVFLMDEPLSNLDAQMRLQMRMELSQLYEKLQTTMVYVTHDQAEAMALSTVIAVMKDGRLIQTGSPLTIYKKPINKFVANFIGERGMNLIDGELSREKGTLWFRDDTFAYGLPEMAGAALAEVSTVNKVILGIRPEHIVLSLTPLEDGLRADVLLTETLGSYSFVHMDILGKRFVAKTAGVIGEFYKGIAWANFDPACIHLFNAVTGLTLDLGRP